MRTVQEIRTEIKDVRREMKAKGIKRVSCFNGGLHGEVYSLNARMFALETELESTHAYIQRAAKATMDYIEQVAAKHGINLDEPEFDRINHGPFEHPVSE